MNKILSNNPINIIGNIFLTENNTALTNYSTCKFVIFDIYY